MKRHLRVALIAATLLDGGRTLGAPPDGGFHLEPKAAIDDVFSDSSDYRRIVDRFLTLTESMQKTRDAFARSVQTTLSELRVAQENRPAGIGGSRCPEATAAVAYARALALGQEYLRTGRELTRHYEQVREYDRLGETLGLTPDYRWKVKRVVAHYTTLLTDYREMKVAFHDQLTDELRFAGCNLDRLLAKAGAYALKDEAWPAPEQLAGTPSAADKAPLPQPPVSTAVARPPKGEPIDVAPRRSGILIYVDNTRCRTGTQVALDGRPVGQVPGATRAAFPTTPGPHELCLLPEGSQKRCSDPAVLRKAYLHEGWTIRLECEP